MYHVSVLKYKNSESNTNYGCIHAADELGGLGSGGRAGAGSCWYLPQLEEACSIHLDLFMEAIF